MERQAFTPKQLEALDMLIRVYPSGVSISDPEARVVFNSLVARDSGLVELVPYASVPSEDAFVLSDAGAEALRAETTEAASNAAMN